MVRVKYIKLLSSIIIILSLSNFVNAANLYWISEVASNWDDDFNWSFSSDGLGGDGVPGVGDIAIFDGVGGNNGDCTIDENVNVEGFHVMGYTGTITQAAGIRMQIGTSHAIFTSGIFMGGANPGEDITIIGDLTISGIATSFTSTVDELDLQGDYTFSVTSTFLHNMGTVRMGTGDGGTYTGDQTFYNLILGGGAPYLNDLTIESATVFTITNTLTIDAEVGAAFSYNLNGGTIAAQGDIIFKSDLKRKDVGTATLLINGTGDQDFTGYMTDDYYYGMCKIIIDNLQGIYI